jgi:thiopeptide-type bacteriocin biosynthesis protein
VLAGLELRVRAPRERHDEILRGAVASLAQEVAGPFFFGRYNKPDWHLRLTAVGNDAKAPLLDLVTSLCACGLASGGETVPYTPDLGPHGGVAGTRLAEQVFHHDTRACLDFLRLEAAGALARSRREISLVLTERYLDLLGFTREQRIAFHAFAYSWAVDLGFWQDEEREILDRKYAALAPGIAEVLDTPDSPELWGGEEAAAVAGRLLAALRPPLAQLRERMERGEVTRDPVTLAWSLTHLHANRLQIEAHGEAILRYLMGRFHEEH